MRNKGRVRSSEGRKPASRKGEGSKNSTYKGKPSREKRSSGSKETAGQFGERRTFKKKSTGQGRPGTDRPDGKGGSRFASKRRDNAGRSTGRTRRVRRPDVQQNDLNEDVRLNKFIANTGVCSRREADELITAGVITVNGKVVTELGTKVRPGDEVRYNNETLYTEKPVYVLLNKPKDYITTADDPQERRTVLQLVSKACKERIYPVGRLDRNTTGLLLLTNDGELTKRLTHPSYRIKKLYSVELDRNLTKEDMKSIIEGVQLDDGVVEVDQVAWEDKEVRSKIGIEIHSGRNRVIRRLFEALGYNVKKLDRVVFAGLTKKDLPRGRYRHLTPMEVNMLKMMTGKKK